MWLCTLEARVHKVHCGNACQAPARRKTTMRQGIDSGVARIDGHPGHDVRKYLADAQSAVALSVVEPACGWA